MKWVLRILAILLISVILLLLSLAVIVATMDVNRYKGLVALAFSKSTGMDLKILGRIDISRDGGFRVKLTELEIRDVLGNLFLIDSVYFTMPYEVPGDTLELDSAAIYRPRYVLDNSKTPPKTVSGKKSTVKKKKKKAGAEKDVRGGSPFQIVIKKIRCDRVSIYNGSFAITDTASSHLVDLRSINVRNGGFIIHLTKVMPSALEVSALASIGSASAFNFSDTMLITGVKMKDNHLRISDKREDLPGNKLDLSLEFKGNSIGYHFRGSRRGEDLYSI